MMTLSRPNSAPAARRLGRPAWVPTRTVSMVGAGSNPPVTHSLSFDCPSAIGFTSPGENALLTPEQDLTVSWSPAIQHDAGRIFGGPMVGFYGCYIHATGYEASHLGRGDNFISLEPGQTSQVLAVPDGRTGHDRRERRLRLRTMRDAHPPMAAGSGIGGLSMRTSTRILVTRPVPESAHAPLRERAHVQVLEGDEAHPIPTEDELIAAMAAADPEILYTLPAHPVTARVIEAAPSLRFVATMGTGYDNIDVTAARARGIRVTNAPGMLDETTADLAFALLLATARQLPQAERFLREGRFHGWTPFMFAGGDVHGRTLGIVGLGRIGRAVARRARGFGMRLIYNSPTRREAVERELGCTWVTLEELLAQADFVSLHCPLTPATRHLMDATALARMKPTAVLINTARGPVVDEAALALALREGRIAGAGIDVFEREPRVHPELLACENAVLLPHIGSASVDTRRRMAERATANILAFLDGRALLDPVTQ